MRRLRAGILTTGLAATILVLPLPSNADRAGYYVGGDVGLGKADIGTGELHGALQTAFDAAEADLTLRPTSANRDDLVYGALVGYRFSEFLAFEAQYLWLGEYALTADVVATKGGNTADGEVAGRWHVKGPALSVVGSWPLSSRWDIYGRAGALWAEMDATLQWQGGSPDERAKIRETTTELIWGIGAAYHASPQWTVRLEYQQVPDVGDSARSGELDIERYTLVWVYSY